MQIEEPAQEPRLVEPGDVLVSGNSMGFPRTLVRLLHCTPPLDLRPYLCTYYEEMARNLLTDFELMILLAALRVGRDAYGVRIAREIEETSGRRAVLGAVYAALDRLERNGYVTSTVGDPTPERGGRAKRFFELTPGGLRAVKSTQRALVSLWTDIPVLKGAAS